MKVSEARNLPALSGPGPADSQGTQLLPLVTPRLWSVLRHKEKRRHLLHGRRALPWLTRALGTQSRKRKQTEDMGHFRDSRTGLRKLLSRASTYFRLRWPCCPCHGDPTLTHQHQSSHRRHRPGRCPFNFTNTGRGRRRGCTQRPRTAH